MFYSKFRRNGVLTIGLTLVASVIAVVACGPTDGGSAIIHTNTRPAGTGAVSSCLARLNRYNVKVGVESISGEDKPIQVKMCKANDDNSAEKSEPKVTYKPALETVRFQVGREKGANRPVVTLSLGFVVPEEISSTLANRALNIVRGVCLRPLLHAWSKNQQTIGLDVKVEQSALENLPMEQFDQTIQLLQAVSKQTDANKANSNSLGTTFEKNGKTGTGSGDFQIKTPSIDKNMKLVMSSWPDRGQLVLFPEITEECKLSKSCSLKNLADANAKFCTAFALSIGGYLGLKSSEPSGEACVQSPAPEKTSGIITGGFMKAEGLQNDPNQFWSRAQFSNEDFENILSPACNRKHVDTVD